MVADSISAGPEQIQRLAPSRSDSFRVDSALLVRNGFHLKCDVIVSAQPFDPMRLAEPIDVTIVTELVALSEPSQGCRLLRLSRHE